MIIKTLRKYFAAGLLFIVPLVLTFYIVSWLFLRLDGVLNEHISRLLLDVFNQPARNVIIPGLGFLTLALIVLTTGFVITNYFGKKIAQLSQFILHRIPVIRHIYGTLDQISSAFLSEKSETFKKAVLFEYPRRGVYSIGFITQNTRGLVQDILSDQDMYSIFLPTTPNPTSGFLLFVPKTDVHVLNISVEEALKLVISGGSVTPQELPPNAQPHSANHGKPNV
ncbi:MAG: DUF502 domain-containing protein [candidate division KSB1 bacterium]|nr:DUF502 domain-containing protein [candidate division KSB1 bacterium]